MGTIFSKEEQRAISVEELDTAVNTCTVCGGTSRRYIKCYGTDDIPCVIIAKRCCICGNKYSS